MIFDTYPIRVRRRILFEERHIRVYIYMFIMLTENVLGCIMNMCVIKEDQIRVCGPENWVIRWAARVHYDDDVFIVFFKSKSNLACINGINGCIF